MPGIGVPAVWPRHRPVMPTSPQPVTILPQRCGAVGSLAVNGEEEVTVHPRERVGDTEREDLHDTRSVVSQWSVLRASGAAALAGLAGCSVSGGGASVQPISESKLTTWHAMGGTNGEALQTLVDEFQSETAAPTSFSRTPVRAF